MTLHSTVRVPTAKGSRYLQQLCKHWSHNLAVEFTETKGTVTFPRNARGADWPGDATLGDAGARRRSSNAAWRRAPRGSSKR